MSKLDKKLRYKISIIKVRIKKNNRLILFMNNIKENTKSLSYDNSVLKKNLHDMQTLKHERELERLKITGIDKELFSSNFSIYKWKGQ